MCCVGTGGTQGVETREMCCVEAGDMMHVLCGDIVDTGDGKALEAKTKLETQLRVHLLR